jgi:TPR repeat protein
LRNILLFLITTAFNNKAPLSHQTLFKNPMLRIFNFSRGCVRTGHSLRRLFANVLTARQQQSLQDIVAAAAQSDTLSTEQRDAIDEIYKTETDAMSASDMLALA